MVDVSQRTVSPKSEFRFILSWKERGWVSLFTHLGAGILCSCSRPCALQVRVCLWTSSSVQFSSVQSCPTLCDPMSRSTPGFPVHQHSQQNCYCLFRNYFISVWLPVACSATIYLCMTAYCLFRNFLSLYDWYSVILWTFRTLRMDYCVYFRLLKQQQQKKPLRSCHLIPLLHGK